MCFHRTSSLGFLLLFWHQKRQNYCDEDCSQFGWYMGYVPLVMAWSLICSKITLNFSDRKMPYYWQNLIFYNHFFCTINRKSLGISIFPKIVLIAKKCPLKMTSIMFLFREVGLLMIYLLLPILTIWQEFGEHQQKTFVMLSRFWLLRGWVGGGEGGGWGNLLKKENL